MDQVAMVNEHIDSGKRLIDELVNEGFHVTLAFWAKPTEESKWYLYMASPFVDDRGAKAAYLLVNETLRNMTDLWIDPLEIKVVGVNDSLTESALAVTRSFVPAGVLSARNLKAHSGITRVGSTTLGGISIDAAYFYPPHQPVAQV